MIPFFWRWFKLFTVFKIKWNQKFFFPKPSSSSSIFGTRGRSLPDILATGRRNRFYIYIYRELEDQEKCVVKYESPLAFPSCSFKMNAGPLTLWGYDSGDVTLRFVKPLRNNQLIFSNILNFIFHSYKFWVILAVLILYDVNNIYMICTYWKSRVSCENKKQSISVAFRCQSANHLVANLWKKDISVWCIIYIDIYIYIL